MTGCLGKRGQLPYRVIVQYDVPGGKSVLDYRTDNPEPLPEHPAQRWIILGAHDVIIATNHPLFLVRVGTQLCTKFPT